MHITVQPGPNHDGDDLSDLLDEDDDNDGLSDREDILCPNSPVGFSYLSSNDTDRDGCHDGEEDEDLAGVTFLTAISEDQSVSLSWINPNASLSGFNISWINGTDSDSVLKEDHLSPLTDAEILIGGLINYVNYTFTIIPYYANGGVGNQMNITVQPGPNSDGDGLSDLLDLDDDNDGLSDREDILCPNSPIGFSYLSSNDTDRDGCHDGEEDEDLAGVTFLTAISEDQSVLLSWINPNASLSGLNLSWINGTDSDNVLKEDHLSPLTDAEILIGGLINYVNYTFTIIPYYANGGVGNQTNITVQPSSNYDGDDLSDLLDEDDDNDGLSDREDILCPNSPIGFSYLSSNDTDRDGCHDGEEDEDLAGVTFLTAISEDQSVSLSWINPNASLSGFNLSRINGTDSDSALKEDHLSPLTDAEILIDGLINYVNYTFIIIPYYANGGVGNQTNITVQPGPNSDGDGLPDLLDPDDDNDGLIEIFTSEELNAVRYQLDGSGQRLSKDGYLNSMGCSGFSSECIGYELMNNVSLAAYQNNDGGKGWQPIGGNADPNAELCQGEAFSGLFDGNGWTVSNLTIVRPYEDCIGLFGQVIGEIRNLNIEADRIEGRTHVGVLAGSGKNAVIISSGTIGGIVRGSELTSSVVGGFIGESINVSITHSKAISEVVSGTGHVGGLTGFSKKGIITNSSAVSGLVNGTASAIGGLIGRSEGAKLISSFAISHTIQGQGGVGAIGGLVGGSFAQTMIAASYAVSGIIQHTNTGPTTIGGLVGTGSNVDVFSSYAVFGSINGINSVPNSGGLLGNSPQSNITFSYAISGGIQIRGNAGGLVGNALLISNLISSYAVSGSINGVNRGGLTGFGDADLVHFSHWDNQTSGIETDGFTGSKRYTTEVLQSSIDYEGIYRHWNGTDIDNADGDDNPTTGIDAITRWCDKNLNGRIDIDERNDANRLWDLGNRTQYPALRCTPDSLAEQRSRWLLRDGKPVISYPLTTVIEIDDDNDGVINHADSCAKGQTDWISNGISDRDMDGCRDSDEDPDDDNDDLPDEMDDLCPNSPVGFSYLLQSDTDRDGCHDAEEDNDLAGVTSLRAIPDDEAVLLSWINPKAPLSGFNISWINGTDSDSTLKENQLSPLMDAEILISGLINYANYTFAITPYYANGGVGNQMNITVQPGSNSDGDGLSDLLDPDDDNDGLIEIFASEELNAVRYQLDGSGQRLSEDGDLNSMGCGGSSAECIGYELMNDISLTDYQNSDGGKGWQPIGNDTDPDVALCQGEAFSGLFDGNGWTVSNLTIMRPYEDCIGLFGQVAGEIRNLNIEADWIEGRTHVGVLAGSGKNAVIVSSNVSGSVIRSSAIISVVGGLIGESNNVRITNSSAISGSIGGYDTIGGLIGSGNYVVITNSSAVSDLLNGTLGHIGGLIGKAQNARIIASYAISDAIQRSSGVTVGIGGLIGQSENNVSIVSSYAISGRIQGYGNLGGLLGFGNNVDVFSSYAVSGIISGLPGSIAAGGLVGASPNSNIVSSYAVSGAIQGSHTGGLVGNARSVSNIISSYAVSGSINGMNIGGLTGFGDAASVHFSYWDNQTSGIETDSSTGSKRYTTEVLQSSIDYEGIYRYWNGTDIDNADGDANLTTGIDDITHWCDENLNGRIDVDEKNDANRLWDLGNRTQYPALRCAPDSLEEQRSRWLLNQERKPVISYPLF